MSIELTPLFVLKGVREYSEEMDVHINRNVENGRLVLVAYAEAGYTFVAIDLAELRDWLRKNEEVLPFSVE